MPKPSTLTVTTVDQQETICIYLQNVREYKKFGHTINITNKSDREN